nr:hypothetical protein [Tanacetum cinerariifolium]
MNLLNEGCSANPPVQNQPFLGYSSQYASMTSEQFQQHQQEQQQAFFGWQQSQVLNRVSFYQEDAWAILKFYPKWDATKQVDLTGDVPGATKEDLLGQDARPRPAGKPRPAKKTKSDATASTCGSSASTQFRELMEQELRLKREAAERDFEAQSKKDRTLMRLEDLRFLATSTKDLDDDAAYWIKKQKRLIKNKMRNDLGDEDDEDE